MRSNIRSFDDGERTQNRSRKPKQSTIRDHQWQPHRAEIKRLYVEENLPLSQVKAIMERKYAFIVTERQFRRILSKWELDKNVKTSEMLFVASKTIKRQLQAPDNCPLVFNIRGRTVAPAKIRRFIRNREMGASEDAHEVDRVRAVSFQTASTAILPCIDDEEPQSTPAPLRKSKPDSLLPRYISRQNTRKKSLRTFIIQTLSAEDASSSEDELTFLLPGKCSLERRVPLENSFAFRHPQQVQKLLGDVSISRSVQVHSASSEATISPAFIFMPGNKYRLETRYREAEERSMRRKLLWLATTSTEERLETLQLCKEYVQVLLEQGRYSYAELLCHRLFASCSTLHQRFPNFYAQVLYLVGTLQSETGDEESATILFKRTRDHCSLRLGPTDALTIQSKLRVLTLEKFRQQVPEVLGTASIAFSLADENLFSQHDKRSRRSCVASILILLRDAWELRGRSGFRGLQIMTTIRSYLDSLEICHPSRAYLTVLFTRILMLQGALDEAECLLGQALSDLSSLFGTNHPVVLGCKFAISDLYRRQKRYTEANALLQEAIRLGSTAFGPESLSTITCNSGVILCLEAQCRIDEAIDVGRKTFDTATRILGPVHDLTIWYTVKLGHLFSRRGEYQLAIEFTTKAYNLSIEAFGKLHQYSLWSLMELAESLANDRQLQRSSQLFEDCLRSHELAYGAQHMRTISVKTKLAALYKDQGIFGKAAELFSECIEARRSDSPETIECNMWISGQLADCRGHAGDPREAIAILEETMPRRIELLGPHHPLTAWAKGALAHWQGMEHAGTYP